MTRTNPELPWQWFNWHPPPCPRSRHAFTTETIWRPGSVPFRLMAWQPDVSTRTLARFNYDLRNWAAARSVHANQFAIDIAGSSISRVYTKSAGGGSTTGFVYAR